MILRKLFVTSEHIKGYFLCWNYFSCTPKYSSEDENVLKEWSRCGVGEQARAAAIGLNYTMVYYGRQLCSSPPSSI